MNEIVARNKKKNRENIDFGIKTNSIIKNKPKKLKDFKVKQLD